MPKFFTSVLIFICFLLITTQSYAALSSNQCNFYVSGDLSSEYELTWECKADSSGNLSSPTYPSTSMQKAATTKYTGRIDRVIISNSLLDGSGTVSGTWTSVKLLDHTGSSLNSNLDYFSGLFSSISTSMMDTPLTSDNSYVIKLFNNVIEPYATGISNGVITIKILLTR